MNPMLLDIVATCYQYFDTIPSPQFYLMLIQIIPIDRNYYPWLKAKKRHNYGKELVRLVAEGYEVPTEQAVDYLNILSATDNGKQELHDFCRGFGLSDKDVEKLFTEDDDNDE